MLTQEEMTKRAVAISNLYGKPLQRAQKPAEKYVLRWAILAGAILPLSAIYMYFILFYFTNVGFTSLADVQAAGMLFVVQLMGFGIVLIVCIKYYLGILYQHYVARGIIFWLSLFFLIPFYFYIGSIVAGQAPQGVMEILTRGAVFSAIILIGSIIAMSVLTYLVHLLVNKGK